MAGLMTGWMLMSLSHAVIEIKARGRIASGGHPRPLQPQTQVRQPVQKHTLSASGSTQHRMTTGDTIHTLCTSNGSPYLNFQLRIMYGTYQLVQKMPGGEKLVAFTRILHRQQPDVLMSEIPTWRVEPLHPQCDTWCEFPVADRPNAVQQWVDAARKNSSLIQAPWLLMIETDYVWMKPIAAPQAESKALSIAFPFGYITPQAPILEAVMRLMYPPSKGPLSDIPATGPAPVLMRWQQLFLICPEWERLTYHIEHHPETKERLGWVREMYAWSTGAALQGVKFDLTLPPDQLLVTQPPADAVLGKAAMFHYTWGTIWKDPGGQVVWKFDKREYTDASLELQVPLIPLPPVWDPNAKLRQQDGILVTEQLTLVYNIQINQMNAAIAGLSVLERPGG